MPTAVRKICSASTPSASWIVENGPLPCDPDHTTSRTVVSSETLVPPGPNRTAAQDSAGSSRARGTPGEARNALECSTASITSVHMPNGSTASPTASSRRRSEARRSHCRPCVIATTMAGTSVSSVSMLEKNRVRHTSQYGSPLKLGHQRGIRERRHEGRDEHGADDERGHPAQRVETAGGIAEAPNGDRRDQRLAAVGDEQRAGQTTRRARRAIPAREREAPPADRSTTAEARSGAGSAVRIAFGGHSTEVVTGRNRSCSPNLAPR